MFRIKLIVLTILFLAMSISMTTLSYGNSSVTINWKVISDPTETFDVALTVCEHGDFIYAVGYEGDYGRVELRTKETGELVDNITLSLQDSYQVEFLDCVVVNEKLYVVGFQQGVDGNYYSLILVLTLTLDPVHLEMGDRENFVFMRVTGDGDRLYVAGVYFNITHYTLLVSEISTVDLSVVKTFEKVFPNQASLPVSIDINPVSGELWVAIDTFDLQTFVFNGIILILNEELEQQKSINLANSLLYSTAFSNEGYGYVSGYFPENYTGFIVKLNTQGLIINRVVFEDRIIMSLAYSKPYLYALTTDEYDYFITVFDEQLSSVSEAKLSAEGEWLYFESLSKMTCDNANLYLAGGIHTPDTRSYAWVMYSIKLLETPSQEPGETTTVTITITKTTTITQTETTTLRETLLETTTVTETSLITSTTIIAETTTLRETVTATETITRQELTSREETLIVSGAIAAILVVVSALAFVMVRKK